jgi:hypothetical protein
MCRFYIKCNACFCDAGYFGNVTQQYISLTTGQGICENVPRPITGKFLISNDGYWEGSTEFLYAHALLSIELNNYKADQAQYASDFTDLKYYLLQLVSAISVDQNLAWNLLLLMEQKNSLDLGGYAQSVSYTVTPSAVFTTDVKFAAMSSRRQGPCSVVSLPTYSEADATVSVVFDLESLQEQCNSTYPKLGSISMPNVTSELFIDVDMNSFSTAAAINMGYISILSLEQVLFPAELEHYATFEYAPTRGYYTTSQYINPVHPGMSPIYCVFEQGSGTLLACFVRESYNFMLPILNNIGGAKSSTYGIPDYCDW